MKRCILWVGAILGTLVICILALIFVPDSPDSEIARLNREIEIELPIGTSRAEIQEWLKQHQFDDISRANNMGMRRIWAQAGRGYFWYWSGDLNIWFNLDEQDRLTSHHIEFEEFPL